jgi:hypothetical protein
MTKHRFNLDVTVALAHDDYGSKRFEGQRAWREVADPER